MPKAKLLRNQDGVGDTVVIQCPGCQCWHPFSILPSGHPEGKVWGFNGNFESPTFTPSLWCNKSRPEKQCHSVVTDGFIKFHEAYHALAGQTVELPDIDT